MSEHKQATLKELRAAAAESGEIQVRAKVAYVWPSGTRIESVSGPPITIQEFFETTQKFVDAVTLARETKGDWKPEEPRDE